MLTCTVAVQNVSERKYAAVSTFEKENKRRDFMSKSIYPENYHSDLNLHDTQVAIKTVKDFFQRALTEPAEPLTCDGSPFC